MTAWKNKMKASRKQKWTIGTVDVNHEARKQIAKELDTDVKGYL